MSEELEIKLGVARWGLFLLWIGLAFLFQFSSNVTWLGIGAILLILQGIRKLQKLKVEIFWVILGSILFLTNLFDTSSISAPIIPIILVAAGIYFVFSALRKK
ncbi:MAG: hypothetical protein ABH857_05660 [Elusimicrobiota bacterium]